MVGAGQEVCTGEKTSHRMDEQETVSLSGEVADDENQAAATVNQKRTLQGSDGPVHPDSSLMCVSQCLLPCFPQGLLEKPGSIQKTVVFRT